MKQVKQKYPIKTKRKYLLKDITCLPIVEFDGNTEQLPAVIPYNLLIAPLGVINFKGSTCKFAFTALNTELRGKCFHLEYTKVTSQVSPIRLALSVNKAFSLLVKDGLCAFCDIEPEQDRL
jgi:hypothetical protein